jgi:alpha-tubulin suppressor-like RCC1 family protein
MPSHDCCVVVLQRREVKLENLILITVNFLTSLFKDGRVIIHHPLYDKVINASDLRNIKHIKTNEDFLFLFTNNETVYRYSKVSEAMVQLPFVNCDFLETTHDHYYIRGTERCSSIPKLHIDGGKTDHQLSAIEQVLGNIDQLSHGAHHIVALQNGDIIVWGYNYNGQIGAPRSTNGYPFPKHLPFQDKGKRSIPLFRETNCSLRKQRN